MTPLRAKVPAGYVNVDPRYVQIAAIDLDDGGRWIAWAYLEGDVHSQFIVAEQDGAHRWHAPDLPNTPPHEPVMDKIKDYLLRIMCKTVGEE